MSVSPGCANPYTSRSGVSSELQFFGRRRELWDVFSRVLRFQSVSVVGERRAGKTALLNALSFDGIREELGVPSELVVVALDGQSVPDVSDDTLIDLIVQSLLLELPLAAPAVGSPYDRLRDLGSQIESLGRPVVVVFDEFDVVAAPDRVSPSCFAFLRYWTTTFHVPFVIASREGSLEPLIEADGAGSSFLNVFGTLYVGPCEPDDIDALIREPASYAGCAFTDADVAMAKSLGGYLPFFVTVACYHLFEARARIPAGELPGGRVESAFWEDAGPHLRYIIEGLPPAASAALQHVLRPGTGTMSSNGLTDGLAALERVGLVVRNGHAVRPFCSLLGRLAPGGVEPTRTAERPLAWLRSLFGAE